MGHGETAPEHLPEDFAQRQQGPLHRSAWFEALLSPSRDSEAFANKGPALSCGTGPCKLCSAPEPAPPSKVTAGPASLGAGPAPRAGEMPASRRAAVQSGGAPVRTDGSRPNPRALGRVVPPPRRAERRARAGLGAAAAADAA
ncbi:unnamed protein product [Rangifer tarandus platyrhynchus]|uniref:Uncharacterized protein n=1 Tax=Rangifer tarandus platyrhynchus TaxID=3082113 RepID=A0AC59ZSE3_RANTA